MDIKKRQEAPKETKELRIEAKLRFRAKAIDDILCSKRNLSNKIKGYELIYLLQEIQSKI